VSLEAMMLSHRIDTDIPGAFLHAYMEGIVHMILEGEISELTLNLILGHTRTTYDIIEK